MSDRDILSFVNRNKDRQIALLKELCTIPAPSHHEERRADFCRQRLLEIGADGVYIDEANNVIFPLNCDGKNAITVIAAHLDTVFPETEPLLLTEDDEKIYCPAVGDDTSSVVVLLLTIQYFLENGICPENGILFVLNSCEEGLGNLFGTRQLFRDYAGRIGRFVSYDCAQPEKIYCHCIGSHRYKVSVSTEGGHSFGCFGNENALHRLAEIIDRIYKITVPKIGNSITTYNVGTVSGGTSVNTIAQNAEMLCEYRSDSVECLEIMRREFERIFTESATEKVGVTAELIGERPCANQVDETETKKLIAVFSDIIAERLQKEAVLETASTDCNIPLSMGIPAVAVSVFEGDGEHTRGEWISKSGMPLGLEMGIRFALALST